MSESQRLGGSRDRRLLVRGRVGLQQRVLPAYRAPFFDALATACTDGLSVFAGKPLPNEGISNAEKLQIARLYLARNHYISNPASSFFFCWQDGLQEWLEDWQPEALIVEANPRYRTIPVAVKWMHTRKRPVIGWGLGAPQPRGLLGALRTLGWPRFLQQFDALIAYSQRGAEQYHSRGFPSERIFVAPNAAAPGPKAPPPPRPPEFQGRLMVLFVGRLQTRKRLDYLLRACAALPLVLQPRLVVVGDGPERASLENLAQTIYPQTEFTGACSGPALAPYFAAADLFVLPGTGGLAVQEAMSYGLPVVVARGDGTQDDLVRPSNGWQIPSDDLSALTATLQLALANVPRLRAMGIESFRIVTEEVNIEKMVDVFLTALEGAK